MIEERTRRNFFYGEMSENARYIAMASPSQKLPPGIGPRKRRIPPSVLLWMAVIVINAAGFLIATWVATSIRNMLETPTSETLLLAIYYSAIALAAIVDALWLDEVFFRGAFRRTYLQGERPQDARSTADPQAVVSMMQRSNISFPILLLLCGGLTYKLFNVINHDFDAYQRRIGKHVSVLVDQQAAVEAKQQAIVALSIRRDQSIVPILLHQLKREDEIAVWAAWALGRFGDLPPSQRKPLIIALLTASHSKDSLLAQTALVALSRLQYRSIASRLHEQIRKEQAGGQAVSPSLIWSLGYVQTLSSVPLLEQLLASGEILQQRLAAWALFQHIDQQGGRSVVPILEARLPAASFEVRCAIVHSLGYTGDEGSNLALMHSYDIASEEERERVCPMISFYLSPDGNQERVDLLLPREALEMKILQAMGQIRASSPEIRNVVEPWLEKLSASAPEESLKYSRAQSLLQGIRSQRNDMIAPAVNGQKP